MTTNPSFKKSLRKIFFILTCLWISHSSFGQCPTITDPSPTICNASGYTYANLSSDYATDNGNGIVWYSASSGGSSFNPNELVKEGTYYADDDSGTCGSRASISVTFLVSSSNQNLDQIYCSNDSATIQTYIDDVLTPIIPPGGNVEVYLDADLTVPANPTDIIPLGFTGYYIVFVNSSSCRSQVERGNIAIDNSPVDPTPALSQEFCSDSNPLVGNLDPGTTATNYNWYENLDAFGSPIPPALSPLTSLVDGNTYYIQIDNIFCVSNPAAVTVTIDTPVDPGTPGTLEYCNDNLPAGDFNLFDELGGTPNTTGTWSGTLATSNGHLGTVNIATLTAPGDYTFTYTVPSTGVCPDATASVTITIHETLSSGIPSGLNPTSFCESQLPANFDLFTLLSGQDLGGQWTQGTSSSDPVVTSPIDLTTGAFTPGTYNFTYTQNLLPNPCPEESTTVQVIVLADPNAGNAVNQTFCENDLASNSPFNLFDALDGSQDNNNGTWTDASNVTISNLIDISGFTVADSPYTFNYTIDNGSCSDTERITITVVPAPESGTPVSTFPEFCASELTTGQTLDLFDLLEGEDQTGIWSDDDGSSALSENILTLDGLGDGTYNFTFDVNAIGSCDDVLVTVTVIINDPPPPTASPSQSFCDAGTIADISVTGTNIQWYDQATGGTPLSGTIDLTDGGMYYATQTDPVTGCESSVRTLVSASINQTPIAGNAGSPVTECNNNSNIDLFSTLDGTQDAGGVWQDNDGTGAVSGNSLDGTMLLAGTYNFTYFIAGVTPCMDASVDVSIVIEESLNPGTSTGTNICGNDAPVDLFPLLGGADIGGTWSPALTSGTGVFDPTTDPAGVYTYTLDNACGPTTANVTVTLTQPANAGTSTTADICIDDTPTDLFMLLGGADSGGTWSPALASGTGVFDPSVDVAGVYTYSVGAAAPCTTDASADVTVTVHDVPPLIVLDPNPEFCMTDNPTVADLDTSVQASGNINWYEDAGLTTLLNPSDVLVDGEDYYGTQSNSAGCESPMSVQIDVTIHDSPTPTLIDPLIDYCINDGPTIDDLSQNIAEYIAVDDNVVWYDAATGGTEITSGTFLTNTTYYAVLIDPVTGCESATRLMLTPDVTACGELVIPDGFSPNGDGVNDTFDMDNVSILYPNFEMEIYNRNGNIVYKGGANTPRFDGTSNQSRVALKGELPVGVYFYIFRFNDNINAPRQGRLYLNR